VLYVPNKSVFDMASEVGLSFGYGRQVKGSMLGKQSILAVFHLSL